MRAICDSPDFSDVNEESLSSPFTFRNLHAGRAASPREDPASKINAIRHHILQIGEPINLLRSEK
jgi:hypothetical protein